MKYSWNLFDADHALVNAPAEVELPGSFHSQADAETWIGENWQALADIGVLSVELIEDGAAVYEMSLLPE